MYFSPKRKKVTEALPVSLKSLGAKNSGTQGRFEIKSSVKEALTRIAIYFALLPISNCFRGSSCKFHWSTIFQVCILFSLDFLRPWKSACFWRLRLGPNQPHFTPTWQCVRSRCSGFFLQSKDMHVRLNGDSKLTVGVIMIVNSCLSFCFSPATDWRSVLLWQLG